MKRYLKYMYYYKELLHISNRCQFIIDINQEKNLIEHKELKDLNVCIYRTLA